MKLAVFVSPHGFGHAARTAAVLAALGERVPALAVTLYTTVPRWFFEESLSFPFEQRELVSDVGLVQRSALEEDLPATLERLAAFWRDARDGTLAELVAELHAGSFDAVLCDISPLGLLAANVAGLPSILLENFTWDWIYEPLAESEPRFEKWIRHLRPIFESATLRIQAEPVCAPLSARAGSPAGDRAEQKPSVRERQEDRAAAGPAASAAGESFPSEEAFRVGGGEVVSVPPIARCPRSSRDDVRRRLGIAPGRAMVLVSFGGVEGMLFDPATWEIPEDVEIVLPGGAASERRQGRLVLLPHHTPLYHPDLVAAADVVVGKLGYSTVAEAVAAATRVLYVPRPGFRESPVLERFVEERLSAAAITLEELRDGAWLARLQELSGLDRASRRSAAGAAAAAMAIELFLRQRR